MLRARIVVFRPVKVQFFKNEFVVWLQYTATYVWLCFSLREFHFCRSSGVFNECLSVFSPVTMKLQLPHIVPHIWITHRNRNWRLNHFKWRVGIWNELVRIDLKWKCERFKRKFGNKGKKKKKWRSKKMFNFLVGVDKCVPFAPYHAVEFKRRKTFKENEVHLELLADFFSQFPMGPKEWDEFKKVIFILKQCFKNISFFNSSFVLCFILRLTWMFSRSFVASTPLLRPSTFVFDYSTYFVESDFQIELQFKVVSQNCLLHKVNQLPECEFILHTKQSRPFKKEINAFPDMPSYLTKTKKLPTIPFEFIFRPSTL